MADLDLQEATRRDDTFNQMLEINKLLGEVLVFPSLMWTWAFDVIKDIIHETILDWMIENEFLAVLDDDGWLDEE